MTREEAQAEQFEISDTYCMEEGVELIDKIYDYFEKKALQEDTSSFEHQVSAVLDK